MEYKYYMLKRKNINKTICSTNYRIRINTQMLEPV